LRYTRRHEEGIEENQGKGRLSGGPCHRSYTLKGTASCGGHTVEREHC